MHEYAIPAAIAIIGVCVLLIVFSIPLDKISSYLMELVPVVFLFFLLANTVVTLIETFFKEGKKDKFIADTVMKIVSVAWRSFIATAVILALSFLLATLSLFLRHFQEWIEKFIREILGLSFESAEKKEWLS